MSQLDNIDKIAFSTAFGNLSIFKSGSIDMVTGTFDDAETIEHNLGYIPMVDAFIKYPSGNLMRVSDAMFTRNLPASGAPGTFIVDVEQEGFGFQLHINDTEVFLNLINEGAGSSAQATIYYLIYNRQSYE